MAEFSTARNELTRTHRALPAQRSARECDSTAAVFYFLSRKESLDKSFADRQNGRPAGAFFGNLQ